MKQNQLNYKLEFQLKKTCFLKRWKNSETFFKIKKIFTWNLIKYLIIATEKLPKMKEREDLKTMSRTFSSEAKFFPIKMEDGKTTVGARPKTIRSKKNIF